MIPVANLVERLRSKADLPTYAKDILPQDGTQYTVNLSFSPVISGSEQVYIQQNTFTTGLNQIVQPVYNETPDYTSGFNITYFPNYSRGELYFYQGSGLTISNTGLLPWAPWNQSNLTVYYQYSKYTDSVLANYISFAVASVEGSLQIGMVISGISGVAPTPRQYTDAIQYDSNTPYSAMDKLIIAEDVEILQELIVTRASYDLAQRERRLGAGNAVKLKDGDTEIDTAGGQKWVADYVKDLKIDYDTQLKFIMMNMFNGYTIRQINEIAIRSAGSRFDQYGGVSYPYIV